MLLKRRDQRRRLLSHRGPADIASERLIESQAKRPGRVDADQAKCVWIIPVRNADHRVQIQALVVLSHSFGERHRPDVRKMEDDFESQGESDLP